MLLIGPGGSVVRPNQHTSFGILTCFVKQRLCYRC